MEGLLSRTSRASEGEGHRADYAAGLTRDGEHLPAKQEGLRAPLRGASFSRDFQLIPHCFCDSSKYVFVFMYLAVLMVFGEIIAVSWRSPLFLRSRSPQNVFSNLLEVEIQHYYIQTSLG